MTDTDTDREKSGLRSRAGAGDTQPSGAESIPQSEDDDGVLTEEKLDKMSKLLPQATDNVGSFINSLLEGLPPRWRNWVVRGMFSIMMITSFSFIVYKGPLWLMFMVFAIQVKCFHEIINIGYAVYRLNNLPWFRVLSWWFLLCSQYFFTFETLVDYFRIVLQKENFLQPLVTYRRFIAFTMYISGIVCFVLSLKKRYYLRQFSQFAWTHVTLLVVIGQSFLIIHNIFEGIFWFLIPVAMIICNDIMAYMFGFFFGRTPLIELSPKKTWEGFIGGAVSTVAFGVLLAYWLLHYPWLICPLEYSMEEDYTVDCVISSSFRLMELSLPWSGSAFFRILRIPPTINVYPVLFHVFVMSLFASIVGPFGGFFASGFKRAFKIKDFGDVIPGHGGLMDRFDCQLLMGTFVNVYVGSFVRDPHPYQVVQQVQLLRPDVQVQVYTMLRDYLLHEGLLNSTNFVSSPR